MNDADIKLSGPAPRPGSFTAPAANHTMPITGCIQNQHQHLYQEWVEFRRILRVTEAELAHWQREATYWRQRAEWLHRKNRHGCGTEYCALCAQEAGR